MNPRGNSQDQKDVISSYSLMQANSSNHNKHRPVISPLNQPKVRLSPLNASVQRKQELVSRLYGQGVPSVPLPSLKWTGNAYRPETKALPRKSVARQLLISASNNPIANRTANVGESLDLSLMRPRGVQKEERRASPNQRDNRFSVEMSSIVGVSVMSPLKPNSRAVLTRTNVYSVKENYLRSRKIRDYSQLSRAPRELEMSSQEHLERIWSNKLIEKMTSNKPELTLTRMNQINTDEMEEDKIHEEERAGTKGLDKYLEEMIEDREQGNIKFMYFNVKQDTADPYDLAISTYNNRNVGSFYTISRKGVTQYRGDKAVDFIPLSEWLVERELYKQTKAIAFFHNFRRWKLLKVWRKGVLSAKRKHVVEELGDKLFYADEAYRDHLLAYRRAMCQMEKLRLIDLSRQNDEITVEEFAKRQKKKQKATADRIVDFSKACRAEFKKLIEVALNRLKENINVDAEENTQMGASGSEPVGNNAVLESLGFPSSLTYGHRAALRRECTRFLRLAYLHDFLAITSLGDIYLGTISETQRLLKTLDDNAKTEVSETQDMLYKTSGAEPVLQIRVNFAPREIPQSHVVQREIKEFNEGLSKSKEFDVTSHVEIEPEVKDEEEGKYVKKYYAKEVPNIVQLWLELEPGEAKLEGILKDWIDNGLKVIGNFERWSKHEELLKYVEALEEWDEVIGGAWEQPFSTNLNALCYISEDALYKAKDESLHAIIVSAYAKASDFLQVFKQYLRYYWLNDQADFSRLFHKRVLKPVDTLTSALKLLDYEKKKFARKIPQGCNLGMLKIDCARARKMLLPSPSNAMKKIELIGNEIVKANLQEVKAWLAESRDQLTCNVVTVEDYVNQKNAWNRISESFQNIRDKADICGSVYNIFPEFSLLVRKDDRQYHTECLQEIKQLNALIDSVSDQQELHLDSIKRKLNDVLIPDLTRQLQSLAADAADERLLTKEQGIERVLQSIRELETAFATCEGLADKYKSYQQTLNMEAVDFPLVEEIREGLELRSTLWKSLKEWGSLTAQWASQQFSTINFHEIGPKADQYAAIASRLDKELPENPISKELKVAVSTFSKAVPIVQDLTSKTLKKTHWDSIKSLLGVDFDIADPGFTLKSLLDLKAVEYQEEIHQIAVQASQEDALRKQLALLDEQWKTVTFTIKQYKYKDTYVLDEAEILLNVMDESLANVNTILGSRYIKALLSEAEGWRNSLLNLQTLLDEWITYQKRWIYLENIFSGQDIKKQLANEATKFDGVDKYFKKFMQKANKTPHPFKLIKQFRTNLIETFRNHNKILDEIEKQLEDYLETKRKAFPRFYFLSNDELLEILANQQQLETIQQALRKCFDNLVKLEISEGLDIVAMFSSEGERVPFNKQSKAKDNVEIWLDVLQSNMRDTLARAIKLGLQDYDVADRKDWVLKHYGQVVATVAQIMWCMATESAIADMPTSGNALLEWYEENVAQIQQLTELVRGSLDSVRRKIIVALVTTDVHARDIIETLVIANVAQLNDFNWQKQLRYYWDEEEYIQKNQGCYVRQVAARLEYGCEYIGPSSRLVITPLTDRCWITITGALHINLGAAPAGPAGTGKTESTKDLAKGLGIYCIVFNCSEQINYKMMARLFSGVVQQGAWTCLDEFNRINIEVLSVIARQMMDIRMALVRKVEVFNFEDKEITLRGHCGIFITMNPGYAGRTELPDNLKVHFRPVSMMIPDYQLIAEIMLFAEGFSHAKVLSKKMVKLYKLASEQLSQQDHYDFGMRAVKSVLVMAGSLKRAEPSLSEDAVLLRAMRDSNIPKFVKDDLPLFHALIKDLFPTLEVQPVSYGSLQTQIEQSIAKLNLQKVPEFILKVLQLYEVFTIRFGVMIVGLTGGGKTTCFEVLRDAIVELHGKYPEDERYYDINLDILNPKAIGLGELYGEVNNSTQEWRDGLASKLIRRAAEDTGWERFWIVFDGPVDSLWIENMNTVLDDTMTLCLSNGQRIKLHAGMKMLFEVQDLAVASPATVSRCGMVFLAGETVGWRPHVLTWLQTTFKDDEILSSELKEMLLGLFDNSVDKGLAKIRSGLREPIKTGDLQLVHSLCNFLEVLLTEQHCKGDDLVKRKIVQSTFVFSFIWGLSASVDETSKDKMDFTIRNVFENSDLPGAQSSYDYYLDPKKDMTFRPWTEIVPEFHYNSQLPFFQLMVPTVETVRQGYCLELLLSKQKPVFFTGITGIGKSVIIQNMLETLNKKTGLIPVQIAFSAQTSSSRTQFSIEEKLQKKRRDIYGAPAGKNIAIFVDDVNMPSVEVYGAQPPIELLRMLVDKKGFYDREKLFWKWIEDTTVVCAAGPPGGGRREVTQRFTSRFNVVCISAPSKTVMQQIYQSILAEHMKTAGYMETVKAMAQDLVSGSIEVYEVVCEQLRPTPDKFHYMFNMRDVSKIFQGIMMTRPQSVGGGDALTRLWVHEVCRVFYDRLSSREDKEWLGRLVTQCAGKYLKATWDYEDVFEKNKVYWADALKLDAPVKYYEEIKDMGKLRKTLDNQLEGYNLKSAKKMQLVFFEDAVEHLLRISRVLRQPKGYIMLIGVGGSGKSVLTRLASFMQKYEIKELEMKKDPGGDSVKDYLKELLQLTGVDGLSTCLILTDTQVANEGLLEDVNSLLNNGEIPNLFSTEEMDKVINDLRPVVAEQKRDESRGSIYTFFVERVRNNLHISLCMSPAGDALRLRCRKFPSLINCCTLNWFSNWPESALLSVSTKFLGDIEGIETPVRKALAEQCVRIHTMVDEKATELFAELRRKVYITPKSYLDLIKVYIEGLKKKRKQADDNKDRLVGGIEKLKETNVNIAGMKKRLEVLQPKLKEKSEVLEVSQKKVNEEQRIATEKEKLVTVQKDEVNEKATRAKAIADEAEAELNILKPELNAAMNEVRQLDRKSISEIKMFNTPPQLVVMVMESVMLLLEEKTDWNSIRATLSDSGGFVDRLVNFGEKVIQLPESVMKRLRNNYLSNPEFEPDKVAAKSVAAKTIVKWVKAMNNFYDVLKKAEPKRKRYQEEKTNLDIANKALSLKVKELDEIKARVAKLRADCEGLQAERNKLADEMSLTRKRLSRAEELISLLTDEDERWNTSVATIKTEYDKLIGDVFLSAAFISYLGPFTGPYREAMSCDWFGSIAGKVPASDTFGLTKTMGNPIEIRSWQQYGLPTDAVSVENAIITMEAMRYPLMVDPQMQANRWVKQLFKTHGLIVMKLSTQDFMRVLSNAIRIGKIVLIEDVEETLDPSLDSLLEKQFYKNESGICFIRLDNKDVEFDSSFKLFMTSKLPNPHYMPEVSIKVTVINFTVTFSGLEDQLLGDVVKQEQPEIEQRRDEIIRKLADDKKALTEAEENILKLLTNSTLEQILDEEEAVETLKNAKFTSSEITRRMGESIRVEAQINAARDSYRAVAIRGSILYFVIADLMNIDFMYQNSLDYIKQVFNAAMAKSPKCETQEERMEVLIDNITKLLYSNISRGLFVAHKTIFSFLICTSIKRKEEAISEQEWNYFIRGVGVFKGEILPNPLPKIISSSGWTLALTMDRDIAEVFGGLVRDITNNKKLWSSYATSPEIHLEKLPGRWDNLSSFQKLLIIKVFRPEILLLACIDYVRKEIGQYYIENSAGTIEDVYQDSLSTSPIVFILSQGADPTIMVLKFAEDHKYREKMAMLSLGQGQGPTAKRLIQAAQVRGDWVLLQNCHLAKSWMRELEQLVEAFKEVKNLHEDFRLFLTSMPADYFPASVLQNGVKLTTEPPRGIKANLKRSYQELTQETFESCERKSETWRKLLFGLCFFHSVVQERRKFGPLGFNIRYEFNDSDLETSITMLKLLLEEQEGVPWEALNYITGHINYGGRVTDDWDRRCLLSILQTFYTSEILRPHYKFSPSGTYFAPLHDSLDKYRKYIEELPLNDPPEIFGMHENANITYQLNESATLLTTILKVQPRVAAT